MSEEKKEKPPRKKAGQVKTWKAKPAPKVTPRTTADAKITDHPMRRHNSRYTVRDSIDIPFWLSTGCVSLDCAISKGKGLPCGMRLTLFRGAENTGKTTTLLTIAAQAQGAGGSVLWIDGKRGLNPDNVTLCGVDSTNPDSWSYHVPANLEDALQIVVDFCEDLSNCNPEETDKFPMLVVLDELANLEPTPSDNDVKAGMRAPNKPMGMAAFLTSFFKKKQIKAVGKRNIFFIASNQLRDHVDMSAKPVRGGFTPAPPMKDPGGRALKHYATTRVDITTGKLNYLLSKEEQEGIDADFALGEVIQYKTSKNNLAPPFRKAQLPWFYHLGGDDVLGMVVWLKDNNYIYYQQSTPKGWAFQGNTLPTLQDWINYFYSSIEAKNYLREYFTQAYLARSNYSTSQFFSGGAEESDN